MNDDAEIIETALNQILNKIQKIPSTNLKEVLILAYWIGAFVGIFSMMLFLSPFLFCVWIVYAIRGRRGK